MDVPDSVMFRYKQSRFNMASEISASSLVQTSGNGVSPAAKEVVVGAAGGVTQVLIGKDFKFNWHC